MPSNDNAIVPALFDKLFFCYAAIKNYRFLACGLATGHSGYFDKEEDEIKLTAMVRCRPDKINLDADLRNSEVDAHQAVKDGIEFNKWTIKTCKDLRSLAGSKPFVIELEDAECNRSAINELFNNCKTVIRLSAGVIWREVQGVVVQRMKPEWQQDYEEAATAAMSTACQLWHARKFHSS